MKIINWLFGSFIDNIKHKGKLKELIYQFPTKDKEIRYNANITIPNNFKSIVKVDNAIDILESGKYKLNITTLPNIAKELKWDDLTDEPFIANIYYIKQEQFKVNYKSDSSILIKDLRNHIIKLEIEGSIKANIDNNKLFLNHILDVEVNISTIDIIAHLESYFLESFAEILANRAVPLSQLLSNRQQLIDFLLLSYNNKFSEIGINIEDIEINNIELEKEKPIYTGIDSTNKESENKNSYYIVKDSKQSGPYTKSDIIWMLDNFEINSRTYIWRKGLKQWIQIKDLMDFE